MNSSSTGRRILVSAGSKYGSTREIGEKIGEVLRDLGHTVDVMDPDRVEDLHGYEAVVLGSAVYAGRWVPSAVDLAHRITDSGIATWLFSSGPVGDPPKPDEDPVDVADIYHSTSAQEHRVFAGKIDKSKLGFAEKAIMVAVRAPEGDFRDWDQITAWATGIAEHLTKETSAI